MNNNINIDTEKLSEEVTNIKNVSSQLDQICEALKRENETLKDYWNSKTSENVFTSFQEFYKALENARDTFKKDSEFLESVVNKNYIAEEEYLKKEEEKLAD